jgi:hypothetical protein
MTRSEIIELTIERLGIEDNYQADTSDSVHFEDFLDLVIATIAQQLPDGEIETCEDLNLGVACCNACHNYLPHVGMKLVILTDGCKAWLCCNLRTALLGPDSAADESSDLVDIEEVLGGDLAKIRGTGKAEASPDEQ